MTPMAHAWLAAASIRKIQQTKQLALRSAEAGRVEGHLEDIKKQRKISRWC